MGAAIITVGIDPEIQLGPITLVWHGVTIALGILVGGGVAAARYAREVGLDRDELVNVGLVMLVAGVVGGACVLPARERSGRSPDPWTGSTTGGSRSTAR